MALTDLIAHSALIFHESELLNSMFFCLQYPICSRKLLNGAVFDCNMKHKGRLWCQTCLKTPAPTLPAQAWVNALQNRVNNGKG